MIFYHINTAFDTRMLIRVASDDAYLIQLIINIYLFFVTVHSSAIIFIEFIKNRDRNDCLEIYHFYPVALRTVYLYNAIAR